ncbi:MAG: glycosyltransferase family 4 protein [Anaerolineae bacterium]|nr:MAG: glycosyltransferase family 4 protein [Anaerolineae bacterium]
MHILLIHQVFVRPEDPGGTRHYDFARYLAEKGHRVTVLAGTCGYLTGERLASDRLENPFPGLEIVRCGVAGSERRGYTWRTIGYFSFMLSSFWAGLRTAGVDVLWGTSPPIFQGWTAWLLARLKGRRWLLEVRDLWPEFAVQVGALRNRGLIALSEWLEGFLYRHSDQIVVNSPGYVEHLQRVGVGGKEILVVPNGVDLDSAIPRRGENDTAPSKFEGASSPGSPLRGTHGLQGKFIALYTGAHGMANDLSQLVHAASTLKQDPRIVIVLVGDGAEKADLQRQARAKQLNNLIFLPPVEKASVPELLGEADCGIAVLKAIPMFTTTYPNKVFDYMAAALPVVAAIDGAIRQVVEEAGAGICVTPGSGEEIGKAIRRLADDPELARKMGRNGRKHVEARFDRRELAGKMEEILLTLG